MLIEKNKTNDSITYELSISKEQLLSTIQERIKNNNWTNLLLADNIDYNEFQITGDKIIIKRKPTSLTTFGQIDLLIEKIAEEKANLRFEIVLFNKLFPFGRIILIGFGCFLTIFALIFNRSLNSLLIVAFGWIFFTLFFYFRTKFERHMMFRYTRLIVKDLS